MQFPKHRVLCYLEFRTMGKAPKPSSSVFFIGLREMYSKAFRNVGTYHSMGPAFNLDTHRLKLHTVDYIQWTYTIFTINARIIYYLFIPSTQQYLFI
jgi:hypothetical protein